MPELPTGWATPTEGGLNLSAAYQVDNLGRTSEEISPAGNITLYVYNNADQLYRGGRASRPPCLHSPASRGAGVSPAMPTLPGFGGAGLSLALLNLIGSGTSSNPQFIIQTLSRTLYNSAGQMTESDAYPVINNNVYLATAPNNPYSSTRVNLDVNQRGITAIHMPKSRLRRCLFMRSRTICISMPVRKG